MQSADKPKVDMTYCMGYIEEMLLACRPKLSAKQYNRLRDKVLGEKSYLRQKEIFSQYVDIVIKR